MPFYDYKCSGCGKVFEILHGMGEKPKGLRCEACGSVEVRRVFQPVGMMRTGEDFSESPSSGSSCSFCSSTSCSSCGH